MYGILFVYLPGLPIFGESVAFSHVALKFTAAYV